MNIVAYVHAYVPTHNAGAETTLHDILRAFVKAGHNVTVVLKERPNTRESHYDIDGVKVVQAKDKRTIVHYMPTADVMFTHFECAPRASLLSQKFKVPVVHLVHNDYDIIKRQIAHGTDVAILNSDWLTEEYKDLNVLKFTVHPPIDPARYRTDRGKKVTLVNLWAKKGHETFYELARRMPEVEFLGVKGGYGVQNIVELPNVEIMDNTPDMREVFSKTKVILMPSEYESYGRVAVEASASGIPAIVTPTRGLQEALGDAAIYVPYGDVEGWEKALRSILSPRKYGTLSKLALANSEASHVKSTQELDKLVLGIEQYILFYKRARR